MIEWIKYFRQRWNDWCGDRDMEVAIRKHLSANGYFGSSAKLKNVRLIAVKRPGWLQVFRFEATVRVAREESASELEQYPGEFHQLFGLVRDDIRHGISDVRVFLSESERKSLFGCWSDGLICLRGAHGLKSNS